MSAIINNLYFGSLSSYHFLCLPHRIMTMQSAPYWCAAKNHESLSLYIYPLINISFCSLHYLLSLHPISYLFPDTTFPSAFIYFYLYRHFSPPSRFIFHVSLSIIFNLNLIPLLIKLFDRLKEIFRESPFFPQPRPNHPLPPLSALIGA